MAISVTVYSNANSSSRSLSFDFVGDILAPDDIPANASCNAFYFKITASATQEVSNAAFPVKIVRSLSDLALFKPGDNSVTRKRATNPNLYPDGDANAYSTIKEMVVDYTSDYINGHLANTYSSECILQRPMKFN